MFLNVDFVIFLLIELGYVFLGSNALLIAFIVWVGKFAAITGDKSAGIGDRVQRLGRLPGSLNMVSQKQHQLY